MLSVYMIEKERTLMREYERGVEIGLFEVETFGRFAYPPMGGHCDWTYYRGLIKVAQFVCAHNLTKRPNK